MNGRQKKLLDILEKIGEYPEKKQNKKRKEDSIIDVGEQVENLLVQEGLVPKKSEKELTEEEIEKLKDACLKMREESVETLNVCISLNAFIISILSLIVSVEEAVSSGQEGNSAVQFTLAVFGILAIIGIVAVLLSAWKTSAKIARKADRYRTAYITLNFMQDQKTGQLPSEELVPQNAQIEKEASGD
ncbi:MAG: OPT/YSL family transporter [Butyrivibrio sp.]|nr:OPT/YSL family transporter [Muribaculum sp.]MCM1552136.1 OPT/YSL family transporter [Butyrivibrio sp.]